MTRDHEQDAGRRPEERKALEALRGLGMPAPSAEETARARAAFLTGSRPGSSDAVAPSAPAPLPLPVRESHAAKTVAWMAVAAAVLIVVVSLYGSRPTDHWVVTDAVARLGVNIEVGCGNPGETVHAGSIATADSSEFEFQLGQSLRLRMLGGTKIQLPDGPGRWFAKDRFLKVESGEVFGTTSGPLGFKLHIQTPEAKAVLTGTTFAVFRTDDATCFCLWNGSLDINTKAGDSVSLPTGQRVFVYRDGRPPEFAPLDAGETMKLSMMDDGGMVNPLPEHP